MLQTNDVTGKYIGNGVLWDLKSGSSSRRIYWNRFGTYPVSGGYIDDILGHQIAAPCANDPVPACTNVNGVSVNGASLGWVHLGSGTQAQIKSEYFSSNSDFTLEIHIIHTKYDEDCNSHGAIHIVNGKSFQIPKPPGCHTNAGGSGNSIGERVYIVHLDLKDSNILITETGIVKLIDFGLAMELDSKGYVADNIMRGTYEMKTPTGDKFDIEIPAFSLDSPHQPQKLN